MKYCISNETFLDITGTSLHSFSDLDGKVSYTVSNKNALLKENLGVISGKTGFTGKAGYCYVGACEDNGRQYIISLLGCGWPPSKSKKWKDSRALLKYGKENYSMVRYEDLELDENELKNIWVINGVTDEIEIKVDKVKEGGILLNNSEDIKIVYNIPDAINAPVEKNDIIGRIDYVLNGKTYYSIMVQSDIKVEKKDYKWCVKNVLNKVLF